MTYLSVSLTFYFNRLWPIGSFLPAPLLLLIFCTHTQKRWIQPKKIAMRNNNERWLSAVSVTPITIAQYTPTISAIISSLFFFALQKKKTHLGQLLLRFDAGTLCVFGLKARALGTFLDFLSLVVFFLLVGMRVAILFNGFIFLWMARLRNGVQYWIVAKKQNGEKCTKHYFFQVKVNRFIEWEVAIRSITMNSGLLKKNSEIVAHELCAIVKEKITESLYSPVGEKEKKKQLWFDSQCLHCSQMVWMWALYYFYCIRNQ